MTLKTPLEEAFRLLTPQKSALKKLNLSTVEDLLYHFPVRYEKTLPTKTIRELRKGDEVAVYGIIKNLKLSKGFRSRIPMAEGYIEDPTGRMKAVWFNQPYLAKMIAQGSPVRVVGKVGDRKGELYFANPEIESTSGLPTGGADSLFNDAKGSPLYPVYPESRGITSRWFYYSIQKVFRENVLENAVEILPKEILEKYHLPNIKTALIWIHAPQKETDSVAARKRFSFEEIFTIQLEKMQERAHYETLKSFTVEKSEEDINDFVKRFPFEETNAQKKAIDTILNDFKKGFPMSRLLEGDVGSGKTAVAAVTSYATVTTRPRGKDYGNLQVAYMAPTEILASQHFESFIKYFKHLPIQIALITGSGCRKFPSKVNKEGWTNISRTQLLKWVANGEIAILIGTHALIQKTVQFKDLAFIVIDEQHRFGTAQRAKLARKGDILPHLLSMTATPIPRTLALTIYGDLDLTLLDKMPKGRKPVSTEIIPQPKRKEVYEKIRKELQSGRQAYVICPRIDEPDPDKEFTLEAKSVKAEAERLEKDVFPEYSIDILHSKMKPAEKDEVMMRFKNKEIDILVATSVVEVGVNVPNATNIIIEGAERFGLAQLHQLRGRVIRSTHQPYCYLFSDAKSGKSIQRLKALVTAKNGFELAEEDLKLRGAGELYGRKQWGISDVGMEAIKNLKMVEAARTEARRIIEEDPDLRKHSLLRARIEEQKGTLHFE